MRDGFFNKKSRHERYKVRDDVERVMGIEKFALLIFDFVLFYVPFAYAKDGLRFDSHLIINYIKK